MPVNFAQPIVITRYTAGAYTVGVFAGSSSATLTVNGNLQPVDVKSFSQNVINMLGKQAVTGSLALRSNEEIHVADEETGKPGDRLTVDGKTYEAIGRIHRNNIASLEHWLSIFSVVAPNAEDASL